MSDSGKYTDDMDRFALKVPKGERVGMTPELYDFLKENGRLELYGEVRIPGRGVVSDTEADRNE